MEYTAKRGDRPTQAHVNYQCPCGCVAGLTYDRDEGSEHLGMCCCGRLLWVGSQAGTVLESHYRDDREYEVVPGSVHLPWGEDQPTALAVPVAALADEKVKRDAGKTLTKVVDPVCGMMFDPETAAATSIYRGMTYYFCATSCKAKFDPEPRQYVQSRGLVDRLLHRK